MRRATIAFIAAVLSTASTASAAEFYKLENLRRSSQDTYVTDTHVIKTRYCYEYAHGEQATLKWNGPGEYVGNKLVFRSGNACDVKGLYRKKRSIQFHISWPSVRQPGLISQLVQWRWGDRERS